MAVLNRGNSYQIAALVGREGDVPSLVDRYTAASQFLAIDHDVSRSAETAQLRLSFGVSMTSHKISEIHKLLVVDK